MIQNRAGIKKIKVKNLINNYYFTNIKKPYQHRDYDWEGLKKSLVKHGQLEPLHVIDEVLTAEKFNGNKDLLHKANNTIFIKKEGFLQDKKYIVMNGNHRFIALKELYGEDYEIDCYIM